MGSEMCIRDRGSAEGAGEAIPVPGDLEALAESAPPMKGLEYLTCLLYTSDAADERSSVDLGGRRIIKKK